VLLEKVHVQHLPKRDHQAIAAVVHCMKPQRIVSRLRLAASTTLGCCPLPTAFQNRSRCLYTAKAVHSNAACSHMTTTRRCPALKDLEHRQAPAVVLLVTSSWHAHRYHVVMLVQPKNDIRQALLTLQFFGTTEHHTAWLLFASGMYRMQGKPNTHLPGRKR
jgi:hypothetical protein